MKLNILAIVLGTALFVLLPWHPYPASYLLKPAGRPDRSESEAIPAPAINWNEQADRLGFAS